MRYVILSLFSAACLTFGFVAPCHADGSAGVDAGVVTSVGSGSAVISLTIAPTAPTLPPAIALPDPLEHPLAAIDQVKQAKQVGWPLLVGAILVMVTKALAYASTHAIPLPLVDRLAAWLAVGKRAVAVAAAGTLAAVGYNTLVAGGTWVAALIATGLAAAGLMHSTTQPAKTST